MRVGGGKQLLKDSEIWAKPVVKGSLKSSAACLATVQTQKGTGKQNRKAKEWKKVRNHHHDKTIHPMTTKDTAKPETVQCLQKCTSI